MAIPLQVQQFDKPQEKEKERPWPPRDLWVISAVVSAIVIAFAIAATTLTILGIMVAVFQWLYPKPVGEPESSPLDQTQSLLVLEILLAQHLRQVSGETRYQPFANITDYARNHNDTALADFLLAREVFQESEKSSQYYWMQMWMDVLQRPIAEQPSATLFTLVESQSPQIVVQTLHGAVALDSTGLWFITGEQNHENWIVRKLTQCDTYWRCPDCQRLIGRRC